MIATSSASADEPPQPVLATGRIVFPAGASSGEIVAFADLTPAAIRADVAAGEDASIAVVAAAEAAADGTFTLRLDPDTLPPGTALTDGTVNFETYAVSGGEQQVFFFPAQIASNGQAGRGREVARYVSTSSGPQPETPDLQFNMRTGSTFNRNNSPAKWLGSNGRLFTKSAQFARSTHNPTVHVTKKLAEIVSRLRVAGRDTDPGSTTDGIPGCNLAPGDKDLNNPEHFANAYTSATSGVSEAWVTQSASSKHTLGIAVKETGGWAEGTGTASIERSATSSAVSTRRTQPYAYWNRVNYQVFGNTCTGRQYKKPIGFYDILAADLIGPTQMVWLSDSCGSKYAGDSISTGTATAVTFGSGVELGTVNVSAQSGYGASSDIHFHFLKDGEIAGNSPLGWLFSSKVEVDAATCNP